MNRESVENMMEKACKASILEQDVYDAKESFEAILAIEFDGSEAFAAARVIAEAAIAKIIHPVILGAEVRRLGLLGR